MPGDWDKNVHPDLVEDEPAAPDPPAAPAETAPEVPDSATDSSFSADESQAPTEPPEWFAAVRDKGHTEVLRAILKNVPYDQLEKDEVFSGLIGNVAERRIKTLQARQEREAADRAKLEAATNNDLYTLGELTQRELQQQLASQRAAQSLAPAMDAVTLFQQDLDPSIQKQVSGKSYGVGKTPGRRHGRIHGGRHRSDSQARAAKARVCTSQVGAERDQRRRTCTRARIRHPWSRPRSDR